MLDSDWTDLESELFWELWKHSPDNMFVLGVDGEDEVHVVNFNDAQLEVVDLTQGKPLKSQVSAEIYDLVMPNYRRCIDSRRAIHYEESECFSRGFERHWSTMLCPTFDQQGKVNFIFGISRDITELKQAQAQAQAAAEEADRANRVKTAFLANMSHEMRTPLNGIQSAVELLNDLSPTDAQQELFQVISASTEALTRLTSDILDHARIEAGQLKLEDRPFTLSNVLDDINRLMSSRLTHKPVILEWQVEDVPGDQLLGDAGRLKQILINLIGNAIKFTDSGQVRVEMTIRDFKSSRLTLLFKVHDTGIGIAQRDIERLFQPFSRIDDSSTRRFQGTGLGLAICKELVEAMGGHIQVESQLDQGSCFSFGLPLSVIFHAAPNIRTELPDTGFDLAGRHVLVVEDNPINQMVTRKLLERLSIKVTTVNHGEAALKACNEQRFDAVLMDWHMPVMDGLEATRRIRLSERSVSSLPVIGLTASAMEDERLVCIDAGMDDVVTKPIDSGILAETLKRLIKQTN